MDEAEQPAGDPTTLRERLEHHAALFVDSVGRYRPVIDWETVQLLREAAAAFDQLTTERNTYRTLSGVGTWHDECRPNRHMAAREIEKSQAVINKLADRISELEAAAALEAVPQADDVLCTVSNIRDGEENDGPLRSRDLFVVGRGVQLLVNVTTDGCVTFSLLVDSQERQHGMLREAVLQAREGEGKLPRWPWRLLYALRQKRLVDGLNGRMWDGGAHLLWEQEIQAIEREVGEAEMDSLSTRVWQGEMTRSQATAELKERPPLPADEK